jgi:hypothetical protein
MIYWRWRRLYDLIHVGTPDERTAMWFTARLMRARLRADKRDHVSHLTVAE